MAEAYKKFQDYADHIQMKALQELLKQKNFRLYMAILLGYCKTFENAFNEKGNVAAFQNGKQAVGQKIFNDIMTIDPEAYIKMCQEEREHLAVASQIAKREEEENA